MCKISPDSRRLILILNSKTNLEPEPVEDLDAADEREASKEPHHAAHPGDFVREGHSSTFSDLASKIMYLHTLFCVSEKFWYLCYNEIIGLIVKCHLKDVSLSLSKSALMKQDNILQAPLLSEPKQFNKWEQPLS